MTHSPSADAQRTNGTAPSPPLSAPPDEQLRQAGRGTARPHCTGEADLRTDTSKAAPEDVRARLLLTPVQAAGALGISRTTLYELMGAGDLAFVLIGRARRVPVVALQQFITKQMQRQGFQP
ncbi:MAG: helix-turn-helix domain-containing protein [Mycobacteriales bacterium]|nr:helix-turn-helix domain-containing protein [Mycobacteriales bacterium]